MIDQPRGATANKVKTSLGKARRMYRYKPLPPNKVRLLIVHPISKSRGNSDDIHATLKVADFDQLGRQLPFEALSYHWGENINHRPVYIHDDLNREVVNPPQDCALEDVKKFSEIASQVMDRDKALNVRPSLYQALYHLRHNRGHITLWVDAICINQEDNEEKEKQVQRMYLVFSKATNVVVWLGPPDEKTQRALDFIREVVDLPKLKDLVKDKSRVEDWICLVHLMRLPWFSRRWVIQELALASNATVYCGKKFVAWDDLRDAISLFGRNVDSDNIRPLFKMSVAHDNDYHALGDIDTIPAKILIETINNIFRRNETDHPFEALQGLEYLVSSLCNFEAADPRDTIHALQNVAKETTSNSRAQHTDTQPPKPDYTKGLLDVYTEFVRWIYATTKRMDIICRMWALPEKEAKDPFYPELSILPSWIQVVQSKGKHPGGAASSSRGIREPHHKSARRINGDSFVGLPGYGPYNASYTAQADVQFGSTTPCIIVSEQSEEPGTYDESGASADEQLNALQSTTTAHADKAWANLKRKRTQSTGQHVIDMREKRRVARQNWLGVSGGVDEAEFCLVSGMEPPTDGGASPCPSDGSDKDVRDATDILLEQKFNGGIDNSIRIRGIKLGKIARTTDSIAEGVIPQRVIEDLGKGMKQAIPDKLWRGLVAERDDSGRNPPAWYYRACQTCVEKHSPNGHINTREIIASDESDIVKEYLKRVQAVIWNRRFFEVDQGKHDQGKDKDRLHGFCPASAKPNDIVCILFGCSVPVILRRGSAHGGDFNFYRLIGECYIYGIMDGDAIQALTKQDLEAKAETFGIL